MKSAAKVSKLHQSRSKHIAKNLKLADRIEQFGKAEAFTTLKDHEESFANNSTYRLINLSKDELGKISKPILEKSNEDLANHLAYNQ